jgi:hypothetical protein
MSTPSSDPFTEAIRLLDEYHRALVRKMAEEIVEGRESFDTSYTGTAEDVIDRYGQHLQCLAVVRGNLAWGQAADRAGPSAAHNWLGRAEEPSGDPVGPDTPLEAGSRVLARWQGYWFPAEVVALEAGGLVRIHYTGWGDEWDEAVPRDTLRLEAAEPEAEG